MKRMLVPATAVLFAALILVVALRTKEKTRDMPERESETITLPEPKYVGPASVEEALSKRRSVRSFSNGALTLPEVSQLLWAAQGMTDRRDLRTAPSAGALYPLEVFLVAGNVGGLEAGIYKYVPGRHELVRVSTGDTRNDLCNAALRQTAVRSTPASIVLAGVYERTTIKYGERGIRYVHMEAGHASENIYVQSVPLGLGTVAIGAFSDEEVKRVLKMEDDERPLYIMPIGRRQH
jgi:SagB-type dehydrogenase family enzyme